MYSLIIFLLDWNIEPIFLRLVSAFVPPQMHSLADDRVVAPVDNINRFSCVLLLTLDVPSSKKRAVVCYSEAE